MTTEHLTRFVQQLPFEPFIMALADGRELHVHHQDFAQLGRHISVVIYHHHNGQIEVVDSNLIVSLRTVYAADLADYSEPPESE